MTCKSQCSINLPERAQQAKPTSKLCMLVEMIKVSTCDFLSVKVKDQFLKTVLAS